MKLVIAIIQETDQRNVSDALIKANIRATKLKTSGGFLRRGNVTYLIGVEDDQLDHVLTVIREHSHERQEDLTELSFFERGYVDRESLPTSITIGGAVVFVLPIDQFMKF